MEKYVGMKKYPEWDTWEKFAWEKVFNFYDNPNTLRGNSVRNLYHKGYALYHLDDGGLNTFFDVRTLLKLVGLEFEVKTHTTQLEITMKWEQSVFHEEEGMEK